MEIIEEAVHLLRQAPLAALTTYYAGTVPFVLGFLYFWADMSRGYNASHHLVPAALALTVLFLVMKCCQSLFAAGLMTVAGGAARPTLTPRRLLRLLAHHAAFQPWGLLVLPVALLITIPFGWCFAFFQNLTVLAAGGEEETGGARRIALSQALLWPAQNHMSLLILLLFSIFIWVNLLAAIMILPHLLRVLFGVETVFSRSTIHLLNTTTLMITFAGTYMCADPVVKAVYVLRCYYGRARDTGADLLAELRPRPGRAKITAAAVLLALSLAVQTVASPAAAGPSPERADVSGQQLERSVHEVLNRLEYRWRLPREAAEPEADSGNFIVEAIRTLAGWIGEALDFLGDIIDWLADLINKLLPEGITPGERQPGGGTAGHIILYLLLFAGAVACVIVLEKMIRRRVRDEHEERGAPAAVEVDLEDETLMASDLPEQEWIDLANDLLGRGQTRLAIRSLYLAALARLAASGLINLARYKTDREYQRELGGRGRDYTETIESFAHITGIFEKAWYGMYETGEQALAAFFESHRRIMDSVPY